MRHRTVVASVMLLSTSVLIASPACRRKEPEPKRQSSAPPAEAVAPTAASSPAPVPKDSPPRESSSPVSNPAEAPSPPVSGKGVAFRLNLVEKNPLAEVEKELMARWNEIRSFSANITMTYDRLDEYEKYATGEGTRDWLKKDGKLLTRSELFNTVKIRQDDEEIPWLLLGQKLTKVSDGRYLYIVDETYEETKVTKEWPIHLKIPYVGGKGLFRALHRLDDLKVIPNEKIDGKEVYLFTGSFMNGKASARHWVDRKTGILRKMEVKYEQYQATFTYTLSEISLNLEFPDDHFEFTPPEGIEIQDLTKPQSATPQSLPGP